MAWKRYLVGFSKGVGVTVAFSLGVVCIGAVHKDLEYINNNFTYRFSFWILALVITSFIITKHKQPKWWMVLSLFLSALVFPFLFGAVELNKKKPIQRKAHSSRRRK